MASLLVAIALLVGGISGCATPAHQVSPELSTPPRNDLERALMVGEMAGRVRLRVRCVDDDWCQRGDVVRGTVCIAGMDAPVYERCERRDGSVEEKWILEGTYEYQRVLRRPGRQTVFLVRAMCPSWEDGNELGRSNGVSPPEGGNPAPGLIVGSSEGFRCVEQVTHDGARVRECFLRGDALIFRAVERPDGEVVRSWFIEGGPEFYRVIEGPGDRFLALARKVCPRWSGVDLSPDVPAPDGAGGDDKCDCGAPR